MLLRQREKRSSMKVVGGRTPTTAETACEVNDKKVVGEQTPTTATCNTIQQNNYSYFRQQTRHVN
jgi:hypothetical protein